MAAKWWVDNLEAIYLTDNRVIRNNINLHKFTVKKTNTTKDICERIPTENPEGFLIEITNRISGEFSQGISWVTLVILASCHRNSKRNPGDFFWKFTGILNVFLDDFSRNPLGVSRKKILEEFIENSLRNYWGISSGIPDE